MYNLRTNSGIESDIRIQDQTAQYSNNSISTISEFDDMPSQPASSNPTSTSSSPHQHHQHDASTAGSYSKHPSADSFLLSTAFYSSETAANHASNLRKSIVFSDSFDSDQFEDLRDCDADGASTTEGQTKPIAMTNSPSFSALSAILENKSRKSSVRPSNASNDTLISNTETLTHPEQVAREQQVRSPDLIDLDGCVDAAATGPAARAAAQPAAHDDIFKTPEVAQTGVFGDSQLQLACDQPVAQRAHDSLFRAPEIVQKKPAAARSDAIGEEHGLRQPAFAVTDNLLPQELPKRTAKTKRQSSLPEITQHHPQQLKEKKKNKFIAFFKNSRRSASTSHLPHPAGAPATNAPATAAPATRTPATKTPATAAPATQSRQSVLPKLRTKTRHQQAAGEIPELRASASAVSLNDRLLKPFKRKPIVNHSVESLPSVSSFASAHNEHRLNDISDRESELDADTDTDDESGSILESPEDKVSKSSSFVEDFRLNRLSIISQNSIISNGEVIFPKSLNDEEVESIVNYENLLQSPSRSVRSRKSTGTETAAYKSLNPQPAGSFSAAGQQQDDGDDDEDVSKFMEFADFIDFGGDLNLKFDLENPPLSNSPILNRELLLNSSLGAGAGAGETSRPISMSFKGLKSPAIANDGRLPLDHEGYYYEDSDLEDMEDTFINEINHELEDDTSDDFNSEFIPSDDGFYEDELHSQGYHSQDYHSEDNEFTFEEIKPAKSVKFSSKILLYDTFHQDDYDRHPEIATCNQLTPQLAQQIKNELNQLKSEMPIHRDSRCFTHFY